MLQYRMGDNWPGSSTAEKGLWVLLDHRVNVSQQYNAVAKKSKCNFRLH